MIYLDHNATTRLHPEVVKEMQALMSKPLNASSIHSFGREAKYRLEQARKWVFKFVGLDKKSKEYNLIFTSSGTEANNLIFSNFKDADVFISATEHSSIFEQKNLMKNLVILKVNKNGIIDLENLEFNLKKSVNPNKFVSVMLANNETGVINPIKEVIKIAKSFSAKVHSDCSQAIGKLSVNLNDLDLDFATLSAHKFGGPLGAGGLIFKAKHLLKTTQIGGRQEKGLRPGTENILAIIGFGKAAEVAQNELNKRINHMQSLKFKFEHEIKNNFSKIIHIVGEEVERLPNTSLILVTKMKAESLLIQLDIKNIAVSSGSACSSGVVAGSHVLYSMGYNFEEAKSAIRISVGYDQKVEDITNFMNIFTEIINNNSRKILC